MSKVYKIKQKIGTAKSSTDLKINYLIKQETPSIQPESFQSQ